MSIFTVILLIIGAWFLYCFFYIGKGAYRSAHEIGLPPLRWVVISIAVCVVSFLLTGILIRLFVSMFVEITGMRLTVLTLLIARGLPLIAGAFVSYKSTFYIIDNLEDVSSRVFGKKESEIETINEKCLESEIGHDRKLGDDKQDSEKLFASKNS